MEIGREVKEIGKERGLNKMAGRLKAKAKEVGEKGLEVSEEAGGKAKGRETLEKGGGTRDRLTTSMEILQMQRGASRKIPGTMGPGSSDVLWRSRTQTEKM